TGFKGVAVSRTEFINGCIQFGVVTKVGKDGKFPEEVNMDEGSLEVIKRKKVLEQDEEDNGGPTKHAVKMKGF
ncbi:MAG: hypothetical protein IH845_05220, partial [Nanoarchaeota archaeon]|nr:hypothetical protein [Nanoarchaeota archaeon]